VEKKDRCLEKTFRVIMALICMFFSAPAAALSNPSEEAKTLPGATGDDHLTPACLAAESYIDLANAGKFAQMGNLFAEKVDYVGPDMEARSRREEVARLYAGMAGIFHGLPPQAHVLRLAPLRANECFLEFEFFNRMATHPSKVSGVDHFTVDEQGKIIRFRPYFAQPLAGTK
jgi:hypothetical protein